MSEEPKLPELPGTIQLFSMERVPGGYSFIKVVLDKNYNVTSATKTEPDVKPLVQEQFKLAVGRHWQDLEK